MTSPAAVPRPEADEEARERDLLEALRAGDEPAYETLIRDYGGRMLAAARRILPTEEDAQDAVQEAFLSAFRKLDSFKGQSKLGTWLHRIAINAALMKLRTMRRRKELDVDELLPKFTEGGNFSEMPKAWSEPSVESAMRAEARQQVRDAIDKLPENYRVALLLRDIEELDNQAVAEALGVTVNAAKIRVHRARLALRELLDPIMNEAR